MDSSLNLCKGWVTHTIDPSNFWMRIGTESDIHEFEEYQNTLDKFYNEVGRKNNVSVESLAQGDNVLVADIGEEHNVALDDEENTNYHWKRAQIARVIEDMVDVKYVDLGYTEIVKVSLVKSVNEELFDFLPPQVFRLGLAGVKPLKNTWSSQIKEFFKHKVLEKDVVASFVEYDDSQGYGKVLIYTKDVDGMWYSLTRELLQENLALPTELYFDEPLCDEAVRAALSKTEEIYRQSAISDPNDESGENVIDQDLNGSNSAAQVGSIKPTKSEVLRNEQPAPSSGLSLHLPSPADFMMPPQTDSSSPDKFSPLVQVAPFDIGAFMQKKTEENREMARLAASEKTTVECKEEEDEEEDEEDDSSDEIDWGTSDLQIGQENAFSDVLEDISREIYKHGTRRSERHELAEFFHVPSQQEESGNKTENRKLEPPVVKEEFNIPRIEERKQEPLTEMAAYQIEKQIKEILSSKQEEELNMICALVSSIVSPDLDVPSDQLTAACTAIIESMIHDADIDPAMALAVLDTYSVTEKFVGVMSNVIKSLKSRYVKRASSVRTASYHQHFTKVLGIIFLHAEGWPFRICSPIQELILSSVECWTLFNKQRKQNQESISDAEHMYLECVETFIDNARALLAKKFPDQYNDLLEEIRQKLLHDHTVRAVRVQLLDILLEAQNNTEALLKPLKPVRRDISTQTENRLESSQGRQAPELCGTLGSGYTGDPWNRAWPSSQALYRPQRGTVDPCSAAHLSDAPSALTADTNSSTKLYNQEPNTVSTAEMHSDEEVSTQQAYSDNSFLQSQRDSEVSCSPSYDPVSETVERKRGFPKSLLKLSPRLQKKFLENHNLPSDYNTELWKKECNTELSHSHLPSLNINAPVFIPQSGEKKAREPRKWDPDVADSDNSIQQTACTIQETQQLGPEVKKNIEISVSEPKPKSTSGSPSLQTDWHDKCNHLPRLAVSDPDLEKNLSPASSRTVPDESRSHTNIMSDLDNRENMMEDVIPSQSLSPPFNINAAEFTPQSGIETTIEAKKGDLHVAESVTFIQKRACDAQETQLLNAEDGEIIESRVGGPKFKSASDTLVEETDRLDNWKNFSEFRKASFSPAHEREVSEQSKEESNVTSDLDLDDSAESSGRTLIKYTSQFLKSLDPKFFNPQLKFEITEPYELKFLFDSMKQEICSDHKEDTAAKKIVAPASRASPVQRYSGQGGIPLELSLGPASNYAKWQSLSELLPPSRLKPASSSNLGTSVDPMPLTQLTNENKSATGDVNNPPFGAGALQDLAQDWPYNLLSGDDTQTEGDIEVDHTSELKARKFGTLNKNVQEDESMRKWTETYFKSVTAIREEDSQNFTQGQAGKKKGKKTKFRPLDEVLKEQEPTVYVDSAFPEDEEEFDSLVSPEALAMYEELDRREQLREEGVIIHPSKLGAHSAGTKKRSLMHIRTQPTAVAQSWVPRRRKCNRCGAEDHSGYECDKEDTVPIRDDQSYLLL